MWNLFPAQYLSIWVNYANRGPLLSPSVNEKQGKKSLFWLLTKKRCHEGREENDWQPSLVHTWKAAVMTLRLQPLGVRSLDDTWGKPSSQTVASYGWELWIVLKESLWCSLCRSCNCGPQSLPFPFSYKMHLHPPIKSNQRPGEYNAQSKQSSYTKCRRLWWPLLCPLGGNSGEAAIILLEAEVPRPPPVVGQNWKNWGHQQFSKELPPTEEMLNAFQTVEKESRVIGTCETWPPLSQCRPLRDHVDCRGVSTSNSNTVQP